MRIQEDKDDKEIIEIQDDVRVGDVILEKGDRIVILEADDKKDDDDEDDKKDKDDDDDEKDEKKKKKEAMNTKKKALILQKMQDGESLSVYEKKFVAHNF